MDFLHKKLLQATTKDQEDKIVDWMLAEAKLKHDEQKGRQITGLTINQSKSTDR